MKDRWGLRYIIMTLSRTLWKKSICRYRQSYAHAENELGKVMYYSADRNVLYTMVGGTLYEYDVEKDWNEAVVEGWKKTSMPCLQTVVWWDIR